MDGLLAVQRLAHLKAVVLQIHTDETHHALLIIHHKDTAAVKFFTVVLYFMHLKYDNVLFKRLFYSGLFLAMFVYVVALLTFHYFE